MSDQHEQAEFLRANPGVLAEVEGQAVASPPGRKPPEGRLLVAKVENFYHRFLMLPQGAALALALWTIATHFYEVFDCFPYLAILSPLKKCGKTRLTEVLALLAANCFRTINISEAALFRLVEAESPTLVLDEAEALAGRSDRAQAIRALLNGGNRRDAVVPRCVGNSHELKMFRVYCPKLVCGIGTCPDTLRDRSIVLLMQRRRPEERVERFLHRSVAPEAQKLRDEIASYTEACRAEIEEAYEGTELPFLEDRAAESWGGLFALLYVADVRRIEELRAVAERLSVEKLEADQDDSLAVKLLADTRAVFGESPTAFSSDLLHALKALEESPWQEGELKNGLTLRRLARMLKPFGVRSRTIRGANTIAKGYLREEFERAWGRYL